MKVLSKYFKVVLCFMAFALCSFMFAFTPTLTAVQAAELTSVSYDKALSAIKMPNENVDIAKEEFKVPLLNVDSSVNYKIRVIDPSGYNHDYVSGTSTDGNAYFELDATNKVVKIKARNSGEYKVVYIVTNGNRTYYSNSYSVNVSNVSYELDFSTPVLKTGTDEIVGYTKNLIKTKLAKSNDKYELPVAYAKITGKELTVSGGAVTNPSSVSTIPDETVKIRVTKDGKPQKENDEGSIFTSNGGKFYITPSETGVYTVEYSFENSENRPTKTFTISVEEDYEASKLKLASTPTMPKVELGKTVTLPKITVNAGSETNVDVNVESIKITKEGNTGVFCELKDNNFEFVMSPEYFEGVENFADMVGNYIVTYTVKGAYETQTLTEKFKIDGVTASSNPVVKMAYNFDSTKKYEDNDLIFGAETDLKLEYESDEGIVLPAVYVEDSVTKNYSDFTIIRMLRKGSTYYYVDNKKYDETTGTLPDIAADDKLRNASNDENIGKTNKAVKFKFASNAQNVEGTYYLEYRVITKQVKERSSYLYVDGTSSEKYSFKVVTAGSHKETTPTVKITNLSNSSVKNTDEVTVKVSSSDTKLDSTETVDTRLKNTVFTYSATPTNLQAGDTFTKVLQREIDNLLDAIGSNKESHIFYNADLINGWTKQVKDKDGNTVTVSSKGLKYYFSDIKVVRDDETKNSFKLDLSDKTSGNVNVIAASINDDGNIAVDSKVLTIKDTTTDVTAPTMNVYVQHLTGTQWLNGSGQIQEFVVGQGVDVKLPTVYVDDTDESLMLNVMYYIDSPENEKSGIKYLSPANKKFYYDNELFANEVQAIDGGVITTSETGIYYVTYTATDVAGNTTVMSFTFEVKDTSNPILSVNPVSGDEITISGNTVTGGKGAVIDFEASLKSADGKNDYTSNQNVTITVKDNGKGLDYQPSGNSRTSYVFNSYGTYTVEIKGSYTTTLNGETLTLDAESKIIKVVIEKKPIEWLGEFAVTEYATTKEVVKLPDIAASNGAVVKVTYLLPGASSDEALEAEKVTENGYTYWKFTTNESSKGTYKVTYTATTNEDVLTKTINIKVGDNVPPTINVGNKSKVQKELVYDGKHDIEYLVELNRTKTTDKNRFFKVTVTNNGKVVYSEDLKLTITDKDDIGSSNTNLSWTNLKYELTGPNVKTGDSSTDKTQYLISGTGKYTLKLTIVDNYDNEGSAKIEFNVVSKSSVKKNNDNTVGAVLIVITLLLVASAILFFTFTGKKGGTAKTKKVKTVKTEKAPKVEEKKYEESKVEFVEETKVDEVETAESTEEVVENTEETENVVVEETTEEIVEESDDEPKSGDVE